MIKSKWLSLLLAFAVSLSAQPSFAEKHSLEYKVKAGYIYNFTKFIKWPNDHSESFNICILGHDPFGSILDPIEKRTVQNKPIRLFQLPVLNPNIQCHIIYQSDSSKKVDFSTQPNALTIGESKTFTDQGGMLAFLIKQGKIKLLVNLTHVKNSRLVFSAKLLEVADVYQGEKID